MGYPLVYINTTSASNEIRVRMAIARLVQGSETFNYIMDQVSQRYGVVNIVIGPGVNNGEQSGASGQDSTNPNAWNIYIDTAVADPIKRPNGTLDYARVEELIAHEIAHGIFKGPDRSIFQNYKEDHEFIIPWTDKVSVELGLGGGTGVILGRPQENSASQARLRFADGAILARIMHRA